MLIFGGTTDGGRQRRDEGPGNWGKGAQWGAAAGWAVSADDYFLTAWVDMPGQIRLVSEMV